MKKKIMTPRFMFIAFLILAAAAVRLIPHLPNVTPVAAIALFGGAILGRSLWAYLLPFGALLLSDIALELFTSTPGFSTITIFVYASFALIVMLGFMFNGKVNTLRTGAAAIGASVLFFVITNFGVWAMGWYGYTFEGLVTTYTLAIPFFHYTLIGNLVYTGALFGIYELAKNRVPALAEAKV